MASAELNKVLELLKSQPRNPRRVGGEDARRNGARE